MLADPSLDPFGPTGKVKLSYVHYNIRGSEKEVLKLTSLPQSWSQVVVCVSISGMYQQSGYFPVVSKSKKLIARKL